jgi:hypothetical protein
MSKPKESASAKQMEQLHALVATTMHNDIKSYLMAGEPVPTQLLAVVIKFLKDNGIESVPVEGSTTNKLAMVLPFPSDQELMSN